MPGRISVTVWWRAPTLAGITAGLVALLAACATQAPQTVPLPLPSTAAGVPSGLRPFYEQDLAWSDCPGSQLQCATLTVPLDYSHPAGGTVSLALKRAPAGMQDHRLGSLVINPGGPGQSGVAAVSGALSVLGTDVRAVFDVVGFDPRGVGGSAPVDCIPDAAIDAWRDARYSLGTEAGIARRRAEAATLTHACAGQAGSLLGHVDTVSAARDMDILRSALGDGLLTYLGVSYGTELGATYAGLFPQRVGRMVLDAGLDPTMDDTQRTLGLAAGFEMAVGKYVQYCLNGAGCPLSGSPAEALARLRRLLSGLADNPMPTGTKRPLTAPMAAAAVMLGVADEDLWFNLTGALADALDRNKGTALLRLSDAASGRGPGGAYDGNAMAASSAITCLDSPSRLDSAGLARQARNLIAASPTFGDFLLDPAILCTSWPVAPTGDSKPTSAAGAAPILVIGTTEDPAAPYIWSVALADQLLSGHLLTYRGFSHTAYGRSNACVDSTVDSYLLRGDVPADGATC